MKNFNVLKELEKDLNAEQVIELSNSIHDSIKLALVDANKEHKQAMKEVAERNDLFDLHKIILLRKVNFLKAKSSDYFILSKYSRKVFGTDELEKTSSVALIFFSIFKENFFYSFDKFRDDMSKEVYDFKKSEMLYNSSLSMIQFVNSDMSLAFKLPEIENFEVDSFRLLHDSKKEKTKVSEEKLKIIEDYHKKEIARVMALLDENRKKRDLLEDELYDLKKDISNFKDEESSNLYKIKILQDQKDYLINYNLKREPVYVQQFDNTVWGDNYPALKVFYKFLYNYYNINFNWSFFTSMMTIESKDVVNLDLKAKGFTKGETGYLFFKVQEFFIDLIYNDYFNWLSGKITIKGAEISESFFNVRVRDTASSLPNQEHIKLIDKLCKDIGDSYSKA